MKKLLVLMTASVFSLIASSCSSPGLVIANWGQFIDMNLVHEFETEHGISVRITNYGSNSEAIGLMEQGNRFDIVIPSEYAVEELAYRNMLQPIDWARLKDLGFTPDLFHVDLLEKLESEYDRFDLLEYGVPYKWGQLGILYNRSIDGIREMLEEQQWNIFNYAPLASIVASNASAQAQARAVGFYESAQDGFAAALSATNAANGINSFVPAELDAAGVWLNQMDTLHGNRIVYAGDEFTTTALDGRYAILQKFSGCATLIIDFAAENVDYGFFVPNETNLFVNSMVIPSNARNVDMAHKFMAFVSEAENAVRNSAHTFYTSTIQTSFDHITGVEGTNLDFTFNWFGEANTDAFGFFEGNNAYNSVVGFPLEGHIFFEFIAGRRTNLVNRWSEFRR